METVDMNHSDRSRLRKTQVHPHAHKSSKEPPNDSAVHLFHAHGRMLSKRSVSLAEGLSQKVFSLQEYPDKSSSSTFDLPRSPVTKKSSLRQNNVASLASVATPSMIHYRCESLPSGSSARTLQHSQSHDCAHSTTKSTPIDQSQLLSS